MIALFLTFCFIIGAIGFNGDGDRTSVIICFVLIGVVWFFHFLICQDEKAWVNRRNYWAMDGKERAKAERQWEREAIAEEEAAGIYEENPALQRILYKPGRRVNVIIVPEEQRVTCPVCGAGITVHRTSKRTGVQCPGCRLMIQV